MNREGDFNYVAHDFWRRRIVMVPPRRNSTYKPSLLYTQQTAKFAWNCVENNGVIKAMTGEGKKC